MFNWISIFLIFYFLIEHCLPASIMLTLFLLKFQTYGTLLMLANLVFVPDLTPPPAPVQSRHGLEAGFQNPSRCRGPGCGAVGKAMLEGYCDKCYVKEQSTRLNQVAHRTPHSPPLVMVGVWHTFLKVQCVGFSGV